MLSSELSLMFVRLLCSILEATAQRWSLFNTVQLSGNTQCCTSVPSSTLGARSAGECSLRCVGMQASCLGYNFREIGMTCELFNSVASTGSCNAVSGCSFYLQVKVHVRVEVLPLIVFVLKYSFKATRYVIPPLKLFNE